MKLLISGINCANEADISPIIEAAGYGASLRHDDMCEAHIELQATESESDKKETKAMVGGLILAGFSVKLG